MKAIEQVIALLIFAVIVSVMFIAYVVILAFWCIAWVVLALIEKMKALTIVLALIAATICFAEDTPQAQPPVPKVGDTVIMPVGDKAVILRVLQVIPLEDLEKELKPNPDPLKQEACAKCHTKDGVKDPAGLASLF